MFDFYFCTRLCILINPSVLISNMTIVFQNYSQIMDFCPKFETFLFFTKHFDKFEGVDFKMMEAFSNYSLNIP